MKYMIMAGALLLSACGGGDDYTVAIDNSTTVQIPEPVKLVKNVKGPGAPQDTLPVPNSPKQIIVIETSIPFDNFNPNKEQENADGQRSTGKDRCNAVSKGHCGTN